LRRAILPALPGQRNGHTFHLQDIRFFKMKPPIFWELISSQDVEKPFLDFDSKQVFSPLYRHFGEDPIVTGLIFTVLVFIGVTVYLILYVIYLRIKSNLYQKKKARKFAVWEQNILPLIGSEVEIPSLIIETIKKRDYELFAEFIAPYLKDTKGDFLMRSIDVLRKVGVMEWERHQLKHSKLTWRRALAVQRLGEFRDQDNVTDLIHALNDEEPIISLNAAGALLKIGDNKLLKKVISVLLKNEHLTEELFAEILLNYESPIDLDYLLNKEVEKYPALARLKVINFIEHYNREEGTTRSIEIIKKSKKAIRILLDDENLPDEVFEEILLKYKNPEELEHILSQKVEKFPKDSMNKIIDYIGYLNRLEGVPILIDLLGKSKNDEQTICLIKALGNLGSEEALPLLVDYLKSGHPAIRALGTLKDETTLEPLSRLLEDKDYWCRYYAASSIFQMGDKGREFLQSFCDLTQDSFARDMITQFLYKPQ